MISIIPLSIIFLISFSIIFSIILYLEHHKKMIWFTILWTGVALFIIINIDYIYDRFILQIGLLRVFDIIIILGFTFIISILIFLIRLIGNIQDTQRMIIQEKAIKKNPKLKRESDVREI